MSHKGPIAAPLLTLSVDPRPGFIADLGIDSEFSLLFPRLRRFHQSGNSAMDPKSPIPPHFAWPFLAKLEVPVLLIERVIT